MLKMTNCLTIDAAQHNRRHDSRSPRKTGRDLLNAEDVPPHVRVPFILSCYRAPLQPTDSLLVAGLCSLCTWHNETANVWSHLLGLIWAMWRLNSTRTATSVPAIARHSLISFHASAVVVLGTSTCAHAFAPLLPVGRGRQLWHVDHSAIIISIAGSFSPALHYSFRCHDYCRAFYLVTVLGGLSVGFGLTLWPPITAHPQGRRTLSDKLRIAVLSSVVAFGLVPLGARPMRTKC